MIRIEEVTKRFGGVTALNHFSLDIDTGGVFGLLGPNGAGKTTLLRMIMGATPPDDGAITLFEGISPGDREASRRIGYMPQQLALYEGLTVEENVRFFGRLYGLEGPALLRATEEVLERVRMLERRGELVLGLSGGLMRRAMLATALVHGPRLLILDEPTAGVDPMLRLDFWNWFRDLASEGTTILITTHHIAEASHCHEVLFLREGRMLRRGTPAQLIDRYGATDLEAAFVQATRETLASEEEDSPHALHNGNGGQGGRA